MQSLSSSKRPSVKLDTRPHRCYSQLCRRAAKAIQPRAQKDFDRFEPPPAPPLDYPPPPPPVPPPSENPNSFPTRRDIFLLLVLGAGAWWLRLRDKEPDVYFGKTPKGISYMVTPTGDAYGLFLTRSNGRGPPHLLMVDLMGNMYYDSDDPSLGMYIVDTNLNVINAFVVDGNVQWRRLGNLADVKAMSISSIGNVKLDQEKVVWAFADDNEPLVVDPRAFVQPDGKGNTVLAYPGVIDEGIIRVKEARKGLFNFGKKEELGGTLQREKL